MKIIKWLWNKAERNAYERIITELYNCAYFHRQKEELYYLRSKVEPDWDKRKDRNDILGIRPDYNAKEHTVIANELYEINKRLTNKYLKKKGSK